MSLITGASVWEQDIYDYACDHVATEGALLEDYQQLAEDQSGSPAFRYLANLILADERRHHQLFNDLAESIRQMAEMRLEDEPIPSLHGLRADRERISSATERLLKQFAKMLKDVRDTTLWGLLVELMQDDTSKHIKILSFISERAERGIT